MLIVSAFISDFESGRKCHYMQGEGKEKEDGDGWGKEIEKFCQINGML